MEGFIDELRQGFLTVDIGVGPLDFMIDKVEFDYRNLQVKLLVDADW